MEIPRKVVVGQGHVEDLVQPELQIRINDRRQRLDAPVEVALHHVSRPDVVVALPATGTEPVDPRVLQIPSNDRPDGDVLREVFYPGAQTADTANDQLDPGTGRGRLIKRLDDPPVYQRVHLHGYVPVWPGRLVLDQLCDAVPNTVRRHSQHPIAGLAAIAGEIVEKMGEIGAEVRI